MCYYGDDITEIEKIFKKKLSKKQAKQLDAYLESFGENAVEEHKQYE